MSEMQETPEIPEADDLTSDDRLWAALGYPIIPIAVLMLITEDKQARPFIRYHAAHALAIYLVVSIVLAVLVPFTIGASGVCLPVFWLATFWLAYRAYQGEYLTIPYLTNILKGQGFL
jgi:uncharacterized membrane protein